MYTGKQKSAEYTADNPAVNNKAVSQVQKQFRIRDNIVKNCNIIQKLCADQPGNDCPAGKGNNLIAVESLFARPVLRHKICGHKAKSYHKAISMYRKAADCKQVVLHVVLRSVLMYRCLVYLLFCHPAMDIRIFSEKVYNFVKPA